MQTFNPVRMIFHFINALNYQQKTKYDLKQDIFGGNASRNSAYADGGPRSPSAHAGPFARPPISISGNFLAHVSAESPSNISPNPSEVISEVSEP